jgi:hypothetical protein
VAAFHQFDVVRLRKPKAEYPGIGDVGAEGTILDILGNPPMQYWVEFGGVSIACTEDELELVWKFVE